MIQVFGTKKHKVTRAALRFFSDRNVDVQFVDIAQKAPSLRELEDAAKVYGWDGLIDDQCDLYKKGGYQYLDYDPKEELAEKPLLLKQPMVQIKGRAVVGDDPEAWKQFLDER